MAHPVDNIRIRLAMVGQPVIDVLAPTELESDFAVSDLKIQYNVRVIVNRPLSMVDVIVSMVYLYGEEKLFSGNLTTGFEVMQLSSLITEEDESGTFHIANDFIPMLINIAFGNTRGYFARECVGTVLELFPFPMIPIDSIQKRTSYELI